MIRALAPLLLLQILSWSIPAVQAEVVSNLYEARVPVADRSPAELEAASRDGLTQVLVKVTGSESSLDNPGLASELGRARSLVQQYAYEETRGQEQSLWLRMEFEAEQVNELVTGAGAPLWTANRPAVLVWLVVEEAGARSFASADSMPELAILVREAFDRRGVPARLPLYDLADSAALSSAEAWRLYEPALRQASRRYGIDQILTGRAANLSTGGWVGDWSFLGDGQRLDRSVTAEGAGPFIDSGVALVVEDMAARFAVAATAAPAQGVAMLVAGVGAYSDYAQLVNWLENLELVEHANVEEVRGESLTLRIHGRLDATQLAALLELNSRLQPLGGARGDVELGYQWLK